ncbi:hypothetical protein GCK32_003366 [Trichostrongylus colubriformis]|uniref:Uncharacterized protein n=1 Tax=Trichostrongylus colubriformis TaxID=6319 RepID=A0AAN8IGZ9_TRICO
MFPQDFLIDNDLLLCYPEMLLNLKISEAENVLQTMIGSIIMMHFKAASPLRILSSTVCCGEYSMRCIVSANCTEMEDRI